MRCSIVICVFVGVAVDGLIVELGIWPVIHSQIAQLG